MELQNEDGGWGLHIEGHSIMFGTALSYITLRLLGEGLEDGEEMAVSKGRKWILDHGGLVAIPSWGKFWVTVWLSFYNLNAKLNIQFQSSHIYVEYRYLECMNGLVAILCLQNFGFYLTSYQSIQVFLLYIYFNS